MTLLSINTQHNPLVEVELSRYDSNTQKVTSVIMTNDYLIEIKLVNDIHYPCPLLKVHYKDYSHQLINYPPDGYSGISFSVGVNINNDSSKSISIDHNFNITNYEIVTHTQQYTEYIISACSNNHVKLSSNISYSTGNDKPEAYKDTTYIISDLLDMIKIDDNKVVKRDIFEPSNKKIYYITPPNNTVWEVISDLLSYASYGLYGYYTLFYNMYNKNTVLVNLSKYLSTIDIKNILPNNSYTILGNAENKAAGDLTNMSYLTAEDIISTNYNMQDINSKEHNFSLAADQYFYNFDYTRREWTTDYFNYNNIVNNYIMQNGTNSNNKYRPFLKDNKSYYLKFSNEYNNLEYPNLYDNLERINKFSDVLQFKVRGFLNRDVGQVCSVLCNSKSIEPRFSGVYVIGRIEHIWRVKNDYTNIVSLIRNTQYTSDNQAI